MNNQSLIYCQRCSQDKRNEGCLGSVSADGYLIMKRNKGNHYTMVMADSYSVICDCGYFIRIFEGKIVAETPNMLNA